MLKFLFNILRLFKYQFDKLHIRADISLKLTYFLSVQLIMNDELQIIK